ncbi:EamA family transporter [Streptomyces sp. NPDC101776]|uniref:EamA family transporter n=1 Tax=Streptomyces sp. NPDC101776 TaxID=3366146 RepID=UPI003830E28C
MTPLVAAAVLLAAVTHACWNALAHRITDKLIGFTLIAGGGALIGFALAPFAAFPAAEAWPYLIVSGVIHVVYFVLLMQSFRLGDFGQAYPIARGTAPLVVTVLAAVFAHEVPNAWAAAGIALSCTGLTGVALWGMRGRRPDWAAIEGLVIPAYALHRWRGQFLTTLRPFAAVGFLGAALSVTAYALVLWAQTRAELAPIAALRESSIIVGAAIGAVFFKERFGAPRIAAAGLLVIGIGLMLRAG